MNQVIVLMSYVMGPLSLQPGGKFTDMVSAFLSKISTDGGSSGSLENKLKIIFENVNVKNRKYKISTKWF